MQHESDASETGPEKESNADEPAPRQRLKSGRSKARGLPRAKAASRPAKSANGAVPKRVSVEPGSMIDPPGSASPGQVDALPAVIRESGAGQLVVPSSAELEVALAQASTLEDLVNFEKMVAVLKKAGEQF